MQRILPFDLASTDEPSVFFIFLLLSSHCVGRLFGFELNAYKGLIELKLILWSRSFEGDFELIFELNPLLEWRSFLEDFRHKLEHRQLHAQSSCLDERRSRCLELRDGDRERDDDDARRERLEYDLFENETGLF